MSFGMGLGSFVSGFERGYGIRQDMADREEARVDRQADREWREKQQGWAEEDRAFQRGERARQTQNRDAIDQINADSRARFDAEAADGKFTQDFEAWFVADTLPRLQSELLRQGDIEGASKLMQWGESEAARKGGRLFAQSMFLAQSGQHGEALDKVIEAGKVRGYIAGDFDIDEKEEIQDEAGNTIGYRVIMRDKDGNETVQDIAVEDIPTIIATFANPVAAWESQQATKVASSKREADIEDYERKKRIDTEYKSGATREDAIKSLRGRLKADPLVDGSVNFDDMPATERERMIAEEIAFINGSDAQATPPARRAIMDNNNGQPVPMAAPQLLDAGALQQAPGLGGAPSAPVQTPGRAAPLAAPARGNAVINGREDPGLPAPPSAAELVDQAARDMVEGKSPQDIARTLKATGVDESAWPPELRRMMMGTAPGGR